MMALHGIRSRRFLLLILVAILALPAGAAWAVTISSGVDSFLTQPGTFVEIGTEPGGDNPPLPAGFFGSKNGVLSDPFTGIVDLEGDPPCPPFPFDGAFESEWVDPHGNVVGPNSAHAVKNIQENIPGLCDTVVRRQDDVEFNAVGDTDTVPIEIVALQLKSVNPIEVTYGSEPPSDWDVFVHLSGTQPQIQGRMELTATDVGQFTAAGTLDLGQVNDPVDNTFDFSDPNALGLPIFFQAQFVEVGNPSNQQFIDPVGSIFHNETGTFEAQVPEPATIALLGSGLAAAFLRRRRSRRGPRAQA